MPASTTRVTAIRLTRAQGAVSIRARASIAKPGFTPVASTETFLRWARRSSIRKAAALRGAGNANSSQVVTTWRPRWTSSATWAFMSFIDDDVVSTATSAFVLRRSFAGSPETVIRSFFGSPSTTPKSLPAMFGEVSVAPTTWSPSVCRSRRVTP